MESKTRSIGKKCQVGEHGADRGDRLWVTQDGGTLIHHVIEHDGCCEEYRLNAPAPKCKNCPRQHGTRGSNEMDALTENARHSSAMDTIAKLSFEVGYLKTGIEHAARDIREGVDVKKVLEQLDRLGAQAEASANALG